nr:hypothetical protein [Tanacetum cinerariifolium]GEX27919.1 hypothetical protein [Tanacetum cinerariifolium]
YPDAYPPSNGISDEAFHAKEDLMKSIQNFLEEFSCIPFKEKPQILLEAWFKFFTIKRAQPEDSNELFQKLLEDLKEMAEYKESLENSSKEVKKVVEQPDERGNLAPILSTKEPEHSLSMGYEHLIITPEMESHEVTESNTENLLPIPSECEDDDFEDIEYVKASLSDPEIFSIEEENAVHQEEEEIDLEEIQDIVLREKLLSIKHLIANIESSNNNPTPDRVLNYFESDNSLLDNFSPEFETFYDYTKETRSGNTTHADNSLPEYDSFCFEIEPDQERLINVMKNDMPNDSSIDPILEEADLFFDSDNSIPSGIENSVDDPEGDIRFLEELLIEDSILPHESSDSNFEDNPSIP